MWNKEHKQVINDYEEQMDIFEIEPNGVLENKVEIFKSQWRIKYNLETIE